MGLGAVKGNIDIVKKVHEQEAKTNIGISAESTYTPEPLKISQVLARNLMKPYYDVMETGISLAGIEDKLNTDEYGKWKHYAYGSDIGGGVKQQSFLSDLFSGAFEYKAGEGIAKGVMNLAKKALSPTSKTLGYARFLPNRAKRALSDLTEYTAGNILASPVEAIQSKKNEKGEVKSTVLSPKETAKLVGEQMTIGTIPDTGMFIAGKVKENRIVNKYKDFLGDKARFNFSKEVLAKTNDDVKNHLKKVIGDKAEAVNIDREDYIDIDNLSEQLASMTRKDKESIKPLLVETLDELDNVVFKEGNNVYFKLGGDKFKGILDDKGNVYIPKSELDNVPNELLIAKDKDGNKIFEPYNQEIEASKYTNAYDAVSKDGKIEGDYKKFARSKKEVRELRRDVENINYFIDKDDDIPNPDEMDAIEPEIKGFTRILSHFNDANLNQFRVKNKDAIKGIKLLRSIGLSIGKAINKQGSFFREYFDKNYKNKFKEEGTLAKKPQRVEPNDVIKLFYKNPKENMEGTVRKEIANIMDLALNLSILSHIAENGGYLKEDFKSSIASGFKNRFFNLLRIKPKSDTHITSRALIEAMIDDFTHSKEFMDALDAVKGDEKTVAKEGETAEGEMLYKVSRLLPIAKVLNDNFYKLDFDSRADIILKLRKDLEDINKFFNDSPKRPLFHQPLVIDPTDGKTLAKYGLLGKDKETIDAINKMNSQAFRITQRARRRLEALKNIFFDSKGNIKYDEVVKFLDKKYEELYKKSYGRKNVTEKIDALAREITYIDGLVKDADIEGAGKGLTYRDVDIYFTHEIVDNDRAMMTQEISPQNSNIALFLIQPKESSVKRKIDFSNPETKLEFARGLLTNLDYKTHKMTDKEVIDAMDDIANSVMSTTSFDDLVSYLKQIDHYDDVKGFMTSVWLYENKNALKGYLQGKTVKFADLITEIDSINSVMALQHAIAGETDPAVGVGVKYDKTKKDGYERFLDVLGDLFEGYNLSRGDIKQIVTGLNYGALPYNQVNRLADLLIDKVMALDPTSKEAMDFVESGLWKKLNTVRKSIDLAKLQDDIRFIEKQLEVVNEYLDSKDFTVQRAINLSQLGDVSGESVRFIRNIEDARKIKRYLQERLIEANTKLNNKDLVSAIVKLEDALNAQNAVQTKEDLYSKTTISPFEFTPEEKSALADYLRKFYEAEIINTIYSERFKPKLLNSIKNVFDHILDILYANFDREFSRPHKVDSTVLIEDLFKYYDEVGVELSENTKNRIRAEVARFGMKMSLRDIHNILVINNALSDAFIHWKPVYSIVPKMKNAFNQDVLFVNVSSKAGYQNIKGRGYQYSEISVRDNPFAIYIISHDASIMRKSYNGGVNRYDALYNAFDKVEKFGKEANLQVAKIFNEFNISKIFQDTLESVNIENIRQGGSFSFIASKRTIERYSSLTKSALEKIDSQIRDRIKKIDELRKEIEELNKEIEQRKLSDKSYGDETVVENYYNGSSKTTAVLAKLRRFPKQNTISLKRLEAWFNYFRKYEWLKKIRVWDKPVDTFLDSINSKPIETFPFAFSTNQAESRTFVVDGIVNIEIATMDLTTKDGKMEALRHIVHEVFHSVYDKSLILGHRAKQTVTNVFTDRFLANKSILDAVTINGKKIDKSQKMEEQIATVVSAVAFNDLVINNSSKVARYLDKDAKVVRGLNSYLNDIQIEINGEKYKIWDKQDLIDLLKDYKQDIYADRLKQMFTAHLSVMNHPKIMSFINNVDIRRPDSIVKGSKILGLKIKGKSYYEWSDSLQKATLTELFAMNPKKEALERILAIKSGFENEANNRAKEAFERANNLLSKISWSKANSEDHKANIIGKLLYSGIGLYTDLIMKKRLEIESFDDFYKLAKQQYEDTVANIAKEIMSQKSKELTWDIETLKKKLSQYADDLANGNKGLASARDTAHRFVKRIWTNTDERIKTNKGEIIPSLIDREDMLTDVFNQLSAFKRLEKNRKFVEEHFSDIVDNVYSIKAFYDMNTNLGNNKVLFGVNPDINLGGGGIKLYLDDSPENAIGEMTVGKGENRRKVYLKYFKESDLLLGVQRPNLLIADPEKYSGSRIYRIKVGKGRKVTIGKAKIKLSKLDVNDGYLVFNANALKTDMVSPVVNFDIRKIIRNNMYYDVYREQANAVMLKQITDLTDSGLFITVSQFKNLSSEEQREYKPVSQYMPSFTEKYGEYYFNPTLSHYFIGTKGWDVESSINKLFGKEFGRVVNGLVKSVVLATKVLRNPILLYRLSSYINQGVSSMILYGVHANADKFFSSLKRARKMIKEYRSLSNALVDAKLEGRSKDYEKLQKELENHPLHEAFQKGLATTIRTDAYIDGTIENISLRESIGNIFENEALTRIIMQFAGDSSTPHGKALGDIFDNLEMLPKIALYLNKLDEFKDPKKASTYTALSFPTYYNLNQGLAVFDEFNPFMKYTANIPKMLLFAINSHPERLASIYIIFKSAIYASWKADCSSLSSKGEFLKQSGDYMAIPCTGYAKYSNSMNPYFLGFNDMGIIFPVDASKTFINATQGDITKLIGITKISKE